MYFNTNWILGNLANLRVLDLRNNRLSSESLPPELAKLNQLNKLYLSANVLDAVPPQVGSLRNLKVHNVLQYDIISINYYIIKGTRDIKQCIDTIAEWDRIISGIGEIEYLW